MSKHTPGPWYAYPNVLQVADKKYWFTDDGARHGDTPNMVIECARVADAHLIAAAPDLLQACQTFAEWLHREDVGFAVLGHDRSTPEGESAWREWYDGNLTLCALAQKQACAAIAKATGEALCD